MKTFISKGLISLLIFLSVSAATLLFSVPKSPIIDRFLMSRGIYIIPTGVEEGLLDLNLEGLRVFYRNRKLGEFSRVRAKLGLKGLELLAVCGSGRIKGLFELGKLKLDLNSANCLEGIGTVSGSIDLGDRGLKGNLIVRDLSAGGLKIDSLKLTFKGVNFEGEIEYMGMKLVGGGTFKPYLRSLENSEINGEFKGSAGRLVVRGRLKNITAQLR